MIFSVILPTFFLYYFSW